MLKVITLSLSSILLLILIYASTKPDSFHYSRSVTINASSDKVFPLVDDLRQWPSWSPYEKLDPNMKKTQSGPPSGVGAIAEWDGNAQAGAGRMEIIKTTPPSPSQVSSISILLSMLKPMKADNQIEFTFEPQGETTKVTWAMKGQSPFIAKVFSVFMNCERMVGEQFEDGLKNLKAIAEKR